MITTLSAISRQLPQIRSFLSNKSLLCQKIKATIIGKETHPPRVPESNEANTPQETARSAKTVSLCQPFCALKYKKANAVWSVFYAIVVYPAAPYYLYQAFSYEHQNIYYNFLINTKNGEIVLTDLRETTQKEKELNSRSLIYDVMYQIKNEKNEK